MTDPIPSPADLATADLRHRFEDTFNPPALTNFLGAAQVDQDLTAIRSISFPPLASGDTITGTLFVDGRLLRSFAPEITVRARPDRVLRATRIGEVELETVTACAPGAAAVVVDIHVRNTGAATREVELGLALESAVTARREPWRWAAPPRRPNRLERSGSTLVGTCETTGAACVQTIDRPCAWRGERLAAVRLTLGAGETGRVGFVHALGETAADAGALAAALARDVPAVIDAATEAWTRELAGIFTPGAGGFSGSLPVLETDSEALRRLYWMGMLGVVAMRRDGTPAPGGRSYDTLMPRYWQTTTFIWDYSLSSVVHALLDPVAMRRQLEHWISTDIHSHYGTEWLTGGPVGVWYAVNDYAMTRLVRDYVRFSGDREWLDRRLATPSGAPLTVAEHVRGWARHWQTLAGPGGLADYGGVDNLLECVGTYTHEVAGLNAANVWCLRAAAELAALTGAPSDAVALREEANALAQRVLELYVEGAGYWNARQPDGRLVPVRHCYDFQSTGLALADDLGPKRRREMIDFFVGELQTETWMRALSPRDPDAATSVRPDHQWNGAYTAWPAEAARALFQLGAEDVALDWLPGLATSTAEGPFAQGHFVAGLIPASHRGAPKGPPQPPYLMDWACSSSGAFVALILEGVFGVRVAPDGSVAASPRVRRIDPGARLRGLVVGGRAYDVTADGLVAAR